MSSALQQAEQDLLAEARKGDGERDDALIHRLEGVIQTLQGTAELKQRQERQEQRQERQEQQQQQQERDIKRMRLDIEARRVSVTTARSVEAQGQLILDQAQVNDTAATASLPPLAESPALDEAIRRLQNDHQQLLAAAKDEGPVQSFVNAAAPILLTLNADLHRTSHDTHACGLSRSGGSGQIKPDQVICSGQHASAQQIDTVIECKPSFAGQGLASAAFQMVQRAQQLRSWQRWRSSFVFVAMSHNELVIWKLFFPDSQDDHNISIQRSSVHEFHISSASPGFQLLTRLCGAQSMALGWTSAAVPTGLQLRGQPFVNVELLAPYRSARQSTIVRGTVGGVPTVAKSCYTRYEEKTYADLMGQQDNKLFDLDKDGLAVMVGSAEDKDRKPWIFIRPVGAPLDEAAGGNSTLLCRIICQAAIIVNDLWNLGLVHGDLSPFNIIYLNGRVKLIDLQTMHRPRASTDANNLTGTPEFIALPRLAGCPASLATELESLVYCFLYVATDFRLHWKKAAHDTTEAYDFKAAPMAVAGYFDKKIVERIHDATLHPIARNLRELISPVRVGEPANLQLFQACFQ